VYGANPGGTGPPGELRADVRIRNVLAQAIFCLTAAVTAAAVIDPAVEWLANHGRFGPGAFTDHSNLDVLPALGVGLCFALAFVAVLARRMLRRNA